MFDLRKTALIRAAHCLSVSLFLVSISLAAGAVGNDRAKKRSGPVAMIVIHSIGGPRCNNQDEVEFTPANGSAREWVKKFERRTDVSIHFVVDREGNVEAGIDEDRIAWHAKGNNSRSIGIELVNRGDGIEPYPDEQMAALIELVKGLKARHPTITRIVAHSEVDTRTFQCGGKSINRKQDPGPMFDFDEFLARVAQ